MVIIEGLKWQLMKYFPNIFLRFTCILPMEYIMIKVETFCGQQNLLFYVPPTLLCTVYWELFKEENFAFIDIVCEKILTRSQILHSPEN